MVPLITVLVALAAYGWYGFRIVAPAYVARSMTRYREDWPRLAADPGHVAEHRRLASGEAVLVACVWPFYVALRSLAGGIARRSAEIDQRPHEHQP